MLRSPDHPRHHPQKDDLHIGMVDRLADLRQPFEHCQLAIKCMKYVPEDLPGSYRNMRSNIHEVMSKSRDV